MQSGNIYSIPLFLSNVSGLKSFARYDFAQEGLEFCFARVIEDRKGSGIIIEVFDIRGNIDTPVSKIISCSRLFNPIVVAGEAIKKKRWRLVASTNYDKEMDSQYSEIAFLMGPRDNRSLWKGGSERPVDNLIRIMDCEEFIVWPAVQIEARIISELEADNA